MVDVSDTMEIKIFEAIRYIKTVCKKTLMSKKIHKYLEKMNLRLIENF